MAATIKIKNSSTAGAAPTSSDLVQGELAVNVTDKRLYTENASGTVVELGTNPSVPVTFPDGSASAPSLTNDGDTNTGLFFPAADTVGIATGGTERARVDSSGNVGLGVTPSAWGGTFKGLDISTMGGVGGSATASFVGCNLYNNGTNWIYKATGAVSLFYQNGGENIWYSATSGSAGGTVSLSQRMTLDVNGNLILNDTARIGSARLSLAVNASTENMLAFKTTTNGEISALRGLNSSGSEVVALNYDTTNSAMLFRTGSTERARIDSSGNLLVGTTTASGSSSTFKSSTASAQALSFWNSATSGTRYFVSFATEGTSTDRGYITYNGTSVAIAQASDERLKENIVDAPSALPKIAALQIRSFDFKEDGRHVDYGVIAQELNQVLPSAVFEGSDNEDGTINKPWSVGLEPIIPVLVKAIQELKAIVDAQAAEIAALKG